MGQHGYYTNTGTGLLCLTHRYYDAGTGRFVTRDPIGYKGGINLYGFAGNNPVNESDPSGFDPLFGGAIPFPGFNPAAVPGAGSAVRVLPRVTSRLGVQGTIIVAGAVAGVELYQYVRSGGRESSGFTALGDKIGTYVGDRLYPNPAQSPIIMSRKTEHGEQRELDGRPTGQALQDAQAARPADVFVQQDGQYIVRGKNAREYIITREGKIETAMRDRSNSNHLGKLRQGDRRHATEEEYEKLKELVK